MNSVKLSVLYVIDNTQEKSGLVVNSLNMRNLLHKNGVKVNIFNLKRVNSNTDIFSRSKGVEKLYREIKKADIVHLMTTPLLSRSIYYTTQIILLLDRPCIVSIRGDIRQKNFCSVDKEYETVFSKLLLRRNTHITAITIQQAKEILDSYSVKILAQKCVKLIPPGTPDLSRLLRNKITLKKYDLIFVGKATEAKGLDIFLKTIKRLNNPNLVVKIIASGDNKDLIRFKNLSLALKIDKQINWSWQLPNKATFSEISMSKILFLPTQAEAWGNVFVEAMLARTIVVATKVGGVPTVLRDGEFGYLIEKPYIINAAKLIINILDSYEAHVDRLAFRAYSYAKNYYTIEKQRKRTLNLYNTFAKKYVLGSFLP